METFRCSEVKQGARAAQLCENVVSSDEQRKPVYTTAKQTAWLDNNTTKISSRVKQIESSTGVRLAEAQEKQIEQEWARHGIGQQGGM